MVLARKNIPGRIVGRLLLTMMGGRSESIRPCDLGSCSTGILLLLLGWLEQIFAFLQGMLEAPGMLGSGRIDCWQGSCTLSARGRFVYAKELERAEG